MQPTVDRYEPRQDISAETSFSYVIRKAPYQKYERPEPQEEGGFILSEIKEGAGLSTSGWENGTNGNGHFVGAADTPDSLPIHLDRIPRQYLPQQQFLVLQKWEGTVSSVTDRDQEFVAVLRDLTDRSRPDEEATLPMEEISDSDKDLLAPGAVFYWNVGYELNAYGQRKRVSTIRFRRLPAWTRNEIESVKRTAEKFQAIFGLDGQSQAISRS